MVFCLFMHQRQCRSVVITLIFTHFFCTSARNRDRGIEANHSNCHFGRTTQSVYEPGHDGYAASEKPIHVSGGRTSALTGAGIHGLLPDADFSSRDCTVGFLHMWRIRVCAYVGGSCEHMWCIRVFAERHTT